MDVREKLVELLGRCAVEGSITIEPVAENRLVDFLANHGVTVQEWVSVKEHLPQENEPEGTVCELVQVLLVNGDVSTGWCNRRTKLWWHFSYGESDFIDYDYNHTPVIAWQPLAQPPKGE